MTNPPTARVRWTVGGLSLIAVCVSLCWATAAHAQRRGSDSGDVAVKTSPKFLTAFRPVVAKPAASTVRVRCGDKDVALGAIVGADGWIVTKASELQGDVVCLLRDGREMPTRIVGVQEAFDLALLKIEAKGLTPVDWRDSNKVAVGSWLATPGLGDDPVAVGVLSVAARKITGAELARRKDGGFLGIRIASVRNGVTIAEVIPKSAAARAGLKADDRILRIAGKAVTDADTLFKTLQEKRPGQTVIVRVKRDDEELDLKVTLGKRPMDRADFQNQLGSKLSGRRQGFPVILQHDTVLRPIDCGGPVVDLDGKVIGINIARAGRTETYAIPAETVKTLLDDLKSGKLAPKK